MWRLLIFVSVLGSWAGAQNGRPSQDHVNSHGWDIRLAVPGEPVKDYPTLSSIPRTAFSCAGKEPGYYADMETGCQAFRVCTIGSTYGFQSFLCPNGTLFNQDVFVCDWWMHVKCQPSQRLVNAPMEKFSNLRLGPQLMKDIKTMLTHPMRNPYDKNAMKNNLIVMQDYKPPAGQLFPNGALIAGPERPPNNIYVPAKQFQQNLIQGNPNDAAFAASTPETRYIPAGFTYRPANADTEVFQRQRLNEHNVQTTQHSEIGNLISNGQAQFRQTNIQQKNEIQQQRPIQRFNQGNTQYTQTKNDMQFNNPQQTRQNKNLQFTQRNTEEITYLQPPKQNFNQAQYTQSVIPTQATSIKNSQRGQLNRARAQYADTKPPSNGGRQNEIVSYTKQQNSRDKQPYTYSPPTTPFTENIETTNSGLKQNLVSSDLPPTVITKTLTYSKVIQQPGNNKSGRPKSRVTVKTWIVKPKTGRLIAQPTSYVYNKPTQPPKERLTLNEPFPYVYNRPTQPPQPARVVRDEEPKPYVYNPPSTTPPKSQRVVEDFSNDPQPYFYNRPTTTSSTHQPERLEDDEPEPYVYNRPTDSSRQIVITSSKPSLGYLPPSIAPPPSTQRPAQLNLPTSPPTLPSRPNIPPTTFKPAARLYIPPESSEVLARQYLPPNIIQQQTLQNAQLRASPTSPTTSFENANDNPSYTVIKQSRVNASRNNLTFADILTKEKLDITVNDIVKDTGNILKTATPPRFEQYSSDDNPNENYLPTESDDSGEKLTSQPPTVTNQSKSARLIAQPARNLEPPNESPNNPITDPLSNLPFYKENALPNTIERTVSLKITIPEKLASYLLDGGNETDFDRLEVLNTGSSNYLVLSNQNTGSSIPIRKVLDSKNTNISHSQALVFSFLADSLNAAKEYRNIIKQDALTTTPAPQSQNLNNEDLSQIINKVSQLTSSQYSEINNYNSINSPAPTTTTIATPVNQIRSNIRANTPETRSRQIQLTQYNVSPSSQAQNQISKYRTNDNVFNSNLLDTNEGQIYSGQLYQLPVPEVTSQIYNRPSSNLVQANLKQSLQTSNIQNNAAKPNYAPKQTSPDIEITKSQALPTNSAKLQSGPDNDTEQIFTAENFNNVLNSDEGIRAQLQDKIVGVIPHPLEDNKLVSYEKDQTYYLFTKLENKGQNIPLNVVGKANKIPNVLTFQLVPSVSYQLEDEKEQQKLLNQFQIDEFGVPRGITRANLVESPSRQTGTLTSDVEYTVEHPPSARQVNLAPVALYKGPSSYLAPQGSVGSLPRQILLPSSRLEQLDENLEGYPKTIPIRRFVF